MNDPGPTRLPLRRLGVDTYQEPVIYMHADCAVCRAEGFEAQSRIRIALGERAIIATLNVIRSEWLSPHEAALSEAAWSALAAHEGELATLSHPEPLESFSAVRAKIYGHPFSADALQAIIGDISTGRYSALETAAFITACAGRNMSLDESIALTRAMIDAGTRLQWPGHAIVVDKHCIGGLPGNRTTPIVVAIAAAFGLTMPKTSSRAITSPAGTADTMETLAPVDLDLGAMRRVVEHEGGCIVWGGAMALSPADDLLIRVERPLDFDSDGQLVASVLSKKVAAGSTHLIIDIPVGTTAKVRTSEAARALEVRLQTVAIAMGLTVRIVQTNGDQPVGRGIGPALEARDVLAVLQNDPAAPPDLREHALLLSGTLLETADAVGVGQGTLAAAKVLGSGAAWRKFLAICEAQGGFRMPPQATHRHEIAATQPGQVLAIDNRRLARAAKLAGAPSAPAAGIDLHVRLGDSIAAGQPLFTLHAGNRGELEYARAYLASAPLPVRVGAPS
ncbi:MAG: thymidine phosphorylase family protein [Pseudomonadota bacterium]|nr:thymidine phosphorylase family protein [Pseudomonadota bacterium]